MLKKTTFLILISILLQNDIKATCTGGITLQGPAQVCHGVCSDLFTITPTGSFAAGTDVYYMIAVRSVGSCTNYVNPFTICYPSPNTGSCTLPSPIANPSTDFTCSTTFALNITSPPASCGTGGTPSGYYIDVTAINYVAACTSATKTLWVREVVAGPTWSTYNQNPVPGGCYTYVVTPGNGASSFNWTCTISGVTITCNNTSCSSATVCFPTNCFAAGTLSVQSVASCGTLGGTASLSIHQAAAPAQPTYITGPTDVMCSNTAVYSCPAVPGATSYTWTYTPITTVVNSGGTTNANNVTFPNGWQTGTVCVNAVNACGAGTARCLNVFALPQIATPNLTEDMNSHFCDNLNGNEFQVYGPVLSGFYTTSWNINPTPTLIVNLSNEEIFFVTAPCVSTTNIYLTYTYGTCGTIVTPTLPVSCPPCRIGHFEDNTNVETSKNILLTPNPSNEMIKIQLPEGIETGSFEIIDFQGKLMEKGMIDGTQKDIDVHLYTSGNYLVRVTSDQNSFTGKIVISHDK